MSSDYMTCIRCDFISKDYPAFCAHADTAHLYDDPEIVINKVAIKKDENKTRLELLSPIAINAIGEVLTMGAVKYQEHNWRKGFKWSRLLGAALRHLLAFMGGQDKDPETGLSHLAHCGCCIMFMLEHEITHKELDDRYKV